MRIMRATQIARMELEKRGGARAIIRKFGVLRSVDMVFQFLLTFMVENFYIPKKLSFGLKEAFLCARPPYSIDWFCRNARVARKIRDLAPQTILDVGGGGNGISKFVHSSSKMYILDIRRDSFVGQSRAFVPIVGDACHLPFKEYSFDAACGVSMLEHIPKKLRVEALHELTRVAANSLAHLPIVSSDGVYVGKKADIAFQKEHLRLFRFAEPTTAEHINAEHMTIEELREMLPNASFEGQTNCYVWLKYMIFSRIPFCYFTGLLYYFLWKGSDNKPPYYEVVISSKNENY